MGNQLAPMASWHPRLTSTATNGGASDDNDGGGAHFPDRLVAVSSRCIFDEEADVELLDTSTSGTGSRVMARAARCAGPSYPRNPPMRAHHGLVLLAGKGQRLHVVDPVAAAVSVLPEHDHRDKTLAASLSVLGRAASTGGEEEGEYKVLSITIDDDLVQSCKVLTLGTSVGGGGGDVGTWREVQKPLTRVRCDKPWVAAVVKGVVYVLAFHRHEKSNWIAAFDLTTEQWHPGLFQGPPASGAVMSALTETSTHLAASFSDTSYVHLWFLMSCGDGEPALWEQVCPVPMWRIRPTGHGHEVFEEHVWVLNGGRFAFVVWSPVQQGALHGSGAVRGGGSGSGERGRQDWVLRVYSQFTKVLEDVAHLSNPTDVAIGVCTRSLLR